LSGRRILLYTEQGLGDAIQFIRYAAPLRDAGATVLVASQPELVPLFATMDGVAAAVSREQPLPEYDVHASVMSLPRLLGTTVETVPQNVPYIAANSELAAMWAERLRTYSGFRVGLVWAGSRGHRNDRTRSMSLDDLAPLTAIPGCQFFSLQIGSGADQIERWRRCGRLVDLGPEAGTLESCAAAIAKLDLIISIDSAPAHLAGAMGRPVWVLLPYVADWRWLRNGEFTPWYPSMRLFRQGEPGDWQSVVNRVVWELSACGVIRTPQFRYGG
jgi:hypothetical protein